MYQLQHSPLKHIQGSIWLVIRDHVARSINLNIRVRPRTRTSRMPGVPATTSRPILDRRVAEVSDEGVVFEGPHPIVITL